MSPIRIKTTSTNAKLGLYLTDAPQFGHVAAVVDTGCWHSAHLTRGISRFHHRAPCVVKRAGIVEPRLSSHKVSAIKCASCAILERVAANSTIPAIVLQEPNVHEGRRKLSQGWYTSSILVCAATYGTTFFDAHRDSGKRFILVHCEVFPSASFRCQPSSYPSRMQSSIHLTQHQAVSCRGETG
jgi:hypothetical protein